MFECFEKIMFREFLLFSVLFFVEISSYHGSYSESHEKEFQSIGSFMKLVQEFERDLNSTQVQGIMKIVHNQNLTKANIRSEIEQWAASQSIKNQQTFSKVESEIEVFKKKYNRLF